MPSEYFTIAFKIAKTDEGKGIRFYISTGPVGDKKKKLYKAKSLPTNNEQLEITHIKMKQNPTM